ncbi:hypothetical protein L873DRAFT_1832665 [Choiromyces venosus 120613-1]|uniref:DDE Tnp4 domain-containing protein n=1 Tax=Choiromyces venosus 120613-1 TaxID=1336337 RepID=A0A3N4K4F9_9PEZI|nr:hypothetical protein L873DRAFT_1832665 [Choiromyces venosus 120613-1]
MLLACLTYSNSLSDLAMKFAWPDHKWLTLERLSLYAHVIERKGAPLSTIWRFIDGTIRGITQPTYCLVYGRRNDSFLWRESNLPIILQKYTHTPDGTSLQVISNFLLSPYQGVNLTNHQKLWNKLILCLQIVAEWAFKEMVSMFGFLNYVKNQKYLLQLVDIQFRVAVLLHNIYMYLYRSQITQYFEISSMELLELPTLSEYFHL